MRERNNIILEYGTYMLSYLVSYVASLAELYYLSGIILLAEAIYLYIHWVRESGSLVELRALFTLAWVGGQGIACFQLSYLQKDWKYVTWLCFFLIYIGFGIGYEWGRKYSKVEGKEPLVNNTQADRLFHSIVVILVLSCICFTIEVVKIGFIPLFSDEPYSYSYFHMSALHFLHYLAISCILIPGISVIFVKVSDSVSGIRKMIVIVANVIALAVPFLYVSRFQSLFEVGLALVTYIMVNRKVRKRTLILLGAGVIIAYIAISVFQQRDASYLNGVFEMKYDQMPIFITQPYMYIANNFENFNCLVEQLPEHSWGIRLLFPFISLTGLKFVFPELVSTPVYLTKKELTTLTMFYDAYYDFGIAGVLLYSFAIGAIAKVVIDIIKKSNNPVVYLFYGQVAIYLGLAFFTTWFSSPATWFWLILTGMIYCYTGYDKNRKKVENKDE